MVMRFDSLSLSASSVSVASFFFSSRRRHTRWPRDWSSDVCSSDLRLCERDPARKVGGPADLHGPQPPADDTRVEEEPLRSEERRVGKECRARGGAVPCKETGTQAEASSASKESIETSSTKGKDIHI